MDQNQVYLIKSGDNSFVETENEIVIGISGGKFGVGTTLPESYLHVTGDTQIDGDLTVKGNFTTVNSTTIQVDDKNIELGVGSTTDLEANGGGITLHGLTNKSINWINSTQAWTSSENFYTANGKKISTDKITALDSDGLSLFDDSDNGLTIKAGKIGVHQSSPGYDLDVNGSGNFNSLYVGGSEVITSASSNLGKWNSGSGTSDKVYNFDISGDGLDYNFSGDQTGKDPNLIAFTGETLIFNNVGGGHTLAIKDSNGNDVAVESSGVTTFSPVSAGIYTYYCTSHPSNMTGTITIYAYEEIYYNSGKVGINTDNPGYDFDVFGSGNFSQGLFVSGNSVLTGVVNGSDQWQEGSEAGEIYYDQGNVGVNKSNPNSALDVDGIGNFSQGLFVSGNSVLTGISSNNLGKWQEGSEAGEIYYNQGNVGINKSNPSSALDVDGTVNISSSLNIGSTFSFDQNGSIGGSQPVSINDIIKWDGNKWIAGTNPGSQQSTVNAPEAMINSLVSGESVQIINFADIYSSPPKIATDLEIDGDGSIIPYSISGVTTSGYSLIFAQTIPNNNYKIHTVFGGKDVLWDTGNAGDIFYNDGDVIIGRNVVISGSLEASNFVGGGGSSTGQVPPSFETNIPLGSSSYPITFGPFSETPKIATTLEIDGDGDIIPYTVSGVSTTGYHAVFSTAIPTSDYILHTVFGGHTSHWTQDPTNNISYDLGDVGIENNLNVLGDVVISGTLEASNFVGGGGSSTGEAPASFETNIPSGSLTHPIAFGPFSQTPKVATTLEIDGDGDIIPYAVSGVSATGYHAVFLDNIPNSNYTIHTVFGGETSSSSSSYWDQDGSNNLSYNSGNVGIGTTNPTLAKLHIEGDNDLLRLKSTRDGAGGAEIALIQDSSTPADEDAHGIINFIGNDADGADPLAKTFSSIRGVTHDALNSKGRIGFFTRNNTSFNEDMSIVAGNVGIGTTNPSAKLQVDYVAASQVGLTLNGSNTTLNNAIKLTDASDNAITLSINAGKFGINGGNVGIGTTNPGLTGLQLGTALVVSSATGGDIVAHRSGSSVNVGDICGSLLIANSDADGVEDHFVGIWGKASSTNGSQDLHFAAGRSGYEVDSPHMTIDSSGNVGIGTTNPVSVHNRDSVLVVGGGTGMETSGITLGMGSGYSNGPYEIFTSSEGSLASLRISDGTDARLTIRSNGNVGIGTTNPGVALEVNGPAGSQFRISRDLAPSTQYSQISGGGSSMAFLSASNNHSSFHFISDDGTDELERMRINSSGNVGIGTTNPSRQLHLYDSSTAAAGTAANPDWVDSLYLSRYIPTNYQGTRILFAHGKASIGGFREDHTEDGSHHLLFYTGSNLSTPAERMRIKSSGNVGIGTTNPAYKLHVSDDRDGNFAAEITNTSSGTTGATGPHGLHIRYLNSSPDQTHMDFIRCTDATATRMRVYSDGDVWTSDSGFLSSDERLKTNIQDATSKLEDIKRLKVRNFEWISEFHPEKVGEKKIGFIAQELEEVFPGLVSDHNISSDDGEVVNRKSIRMGALIPVLTKAIQEQQTMIEDLKSQNESQQSIIDDLIDRTQTLENK